MKLLKYFTGSLIISFGVLIVLALILGSMQIELAEDMTQYILVIWVVLAVVLLPLAKKIIRI